MLLRPKKLRKYHEMELTLQHMREGEESAVIPLACSGLSRAGGNAPRCAKAGQLNASLQHGFELQGQRERHFG